MNIYIFEHAKKLYLDASLRVINQVRRKPDSVIGLATGQSPLGIYHQLIHDHQQHGTDYSHVLTFNLDEYVGLMPTHPHSYFQFMVKELFEPIGIHMNNIHIPSGIANNLDLECKKYDSLLDLHQIDIQILGIGSNGHIGFNEPGTSFESRTHVINLDYKTRVDNSRFFSSISDVPTQAITMGISHIMKAKEIILVAIGAKKSEAVFRMIKGPITADCPASILQKHPNVHIYLDFLAAQQLHEKIHE